MTTLTTSTDTTSTDTTSTDTTWTDWATLRDNVSGRLVTREDPEYADARLGWIVNVDQRPAAILEVAHVGDVVEAVGFARDRGLAVSAQPGGHAARTTVDDTLLLRTRALGGIEIDRARGTATVGAGVKWGELCAALDGTGLMALVGSNPDVTVVGLALGGGVSWFTRAHGFTANSVVAFDVVTACGELEHVTRASDPDLFWALRGGGGDFAIVVRVELALFPAPEMHGGQLFWPVEHAPAVLRAFRDLALVAPRELTLWAHVMHFPPMPELPEPIRGQSFVTVAATYLGSKQLFDALLWSLRDAAPVVMDSMRPIQPSEVGDVAQEPVDPMPSMEHSMLLTGFDDAAIDALLAVVGTPGATPLMMTQVRGLGGAFADDNPAGGAVRPVSEPFQLMSVGVPAVPELAAVIPHAFAALDAALGGVASGYRMPNFAGAAQSDAGGYDADRLARLRALKIDRDPDGVIRSNKPVLGR
ncbi:FAD-binding oxidoreductase [Nocardioides bigeumensis]|uniref:FAD-binding oxidoreductase n=1 Tax=Nocardioides bigeumensis TaxID=433657 RepID=A0ABP5KNF8_9ACTN